MLKCLKYDSFVPLDKIYSVVALVPIYNEIELLNSYFENVSQFVDGIICLDDESTDGSYEQCIGEKILMRVQKQRTEFNDLENRTFLIKLCHKFKVEWILFLDVDERLVGDPNEFRQKIKNAGYVNAFSFPRYQMWDSEDTYRVDYPCTDKGIEFKPRLIRNQGNLYFNTSSKLHFSFLPYRLNFVEKMNIRIKHLGNLTKAYRIAKYNMYKQFDPNNEFQFCGYEHLLDENVTLAKFE